MKKILFLALLLTVSVWLGDCSRDKEIGTVILITIDTLRADHLGMFGYTRNTSPFLDSLAAKGTNFVRAMASSSHTAPSHATMFTSLHPAQHGVLANGQTLDDRFLTVAELFKQNGYQTAAFTSINFLRGLRQGFDHFDAPVFHTNGIRIRSAALTIDQVVKWLSNRKHREKSFLWIHLYDVHQSLPEFETDLQKSYLRRVTEQKSGPSWIRFLISKRGHFRNIWEKTKLLQIIDRYDAQILNVDTEIHRLYKKAEAMKRLNNSMWIITADHGEGLGNHRYIGHGQRIYQEQLHVPLIFYFPDQRFEPQKVPSLVTHVDLMPTIGELLKWKLQGQVFPPEGASLASFISAEEKTQHKDYAFAQRRPPDEVTRSEWEEGEVYSLQTSRYKYIEHTVANDEFFDLQKDPFELKNITSDSREKQELKAALEKIYGKFLAQAKSIGTKPVVVEQEYVDELKALGYIN